MKNFSKTYLFKFVAVIIITYTLVYQPVEAHAFAAAAPVVVGALVAGSVLVAAGAVNYHQPYPTPDVPAYIRRTGNLVGALSVAAVAKWTEYNNYNQELLKSKAVGLLVALNDWKNVALQRAAEFPLLVAALRYNANAVVDGSVPGGLSPDMAVGTFVSVGGIIVQTIDKPIFHDVARSSYNCSVDPPITNGSLLVWHENLGCTQIRVYSVPVNTVPPPPPFYQTRIPEQTAAMVSDYAIDGAITGNAMNDEIKKLMPLIPRAVVKPVDVASPNGDVENAPPFIPPVVNVPAKPVSALGSDNVVAQTTRTADATTALQTAQAAYTANPTADTLAALNSAQSALTASQAALTKAEEESKVSYNNPDPETGKTLNFDKWKNLRGIMSTIFPFSLIASLTGIMEQFLGSPTAPVFTLPVYSTASINVNLSIFDPIAAIIRWAIALLMSFAIIQYIVNFYRGK